MVNINKVLKAGDRIALMIPNGVMWVAIDQAAAGLGYNYSAFIS